MKKLLVLQMRPEDATADSEFEAILRVAGLKADEVHRFRLEQEIPTIHLKDYWGVIAGGSPYDVTTPEEEKSPVQKGIEDFYTSLFDRILPRDFPFLGCCSGNGLLGKYGRAPLSRTYAEPVGSVEITVTGEGAEDPMLKGLPSRFTALVGHKEACDAVPEGATLLASSETCPVQMFRMGKNVYATQFHPEADAREFVLRIKTYADHGYFDPENAQGLIDALADIQTPVPKEILRRFVRFYKTP